jgi:hypothetical protein
MESEPIRSDTDIPSFASYDELIPRVQRGPARVWLAVAILTVVILGRESGLFDYSLYHFVAGTHVQVTLNANEFHSDGERLIKTDHSMDSTTTTKATHWNATPIGSQVPGWSTDLAKEIEQQLKNETQLSVQIKSVELAGWYWLPLYKSGTCSFRVYIKAVDEDSLGYNGELTGKTDFTFSGISSVRSLRLAVADEIAIRIRRVVKETLHRDRPAKLK